MSDDLVIGGKSFSSRLVVGTGRYRTNEEMVEAIEASGTEMVTVAIRRLNLDDPTQKTILDYIDCRNTTSCPTPPVAPPSRKPCSWPASAAKSPRPTS